MTFDRRLANITGPVV